MREVAEAIKNADSVIALTGAGISTESGIPDFRSKGGLWSRYEIEEYGYIHNLLENPGRVWKMFADMIKNFEKAKPNSAHYALAEMEKMGVLEAVITQNVDSLHQEAGSRNVVELHGNMRELYCMACGRRYGYKDIDLAILPPECICGGVVRPNVILFGEEPPRDALTKAHFYASKSDAIIVAGTSCAVYPAAEIPLIVKRNGGKIIEINRDETEITPLADYVVRGRLGEVMPELVEEIRNLL